MVEEAKEQHAQKGVWTMGKEDLNKWKHPVLMDLNLNLTFCSDGSTLHNEVDSTQSSSESQPITHSLTEIDKQIVKFVWKCKGRK